MHKAGFAVVLFIFLALACVSSSVWCQEPPEDDEDAGEDMVYSTSASGDGAIHPYMEYRKRVEAAQNISSGGQSIDIPANGDKPHEVLHYPPKK